MVSGGVTLHDHLVVSRTIPTYIQHLTRQIYKYFSFYCFFLPEDNCVAAGCLSDWGSLWVESGVVKYFLSSNIVGLQILLSRLFHSLLSGGSLNWLWYQYNCVIVRVLLSGFFNDKILSIEKHLDSNIFPLHLTLTRNGRSDAPTREGNIIYGI